MPVVSSRVICLIVQKVFITKSLTLITGQKSIHVFWLPLEVVDETTTDDDGDRLLLVMLESRRPKQQQSVYIIHVVNFYTVMICLVKPEMTAASLCFICMTCLHDCFGRVIARCCLSSLLQMLILFKLPLTCLSSFIVFSFLSFPFYCERQKDMKGKCLTQEQQEIILGKRLPLGLFLSPLEYFHLLLDVHFLWFSHSLALMSLWLFFSSLLSASYFLILQSFVF